MARNEVEASKHVQQSTSEISANDAEKKEQDKVLQTPDTGTRGHGLQTHQAQIEGPTAQPQFVNPDTGEPLDLVEEQKKWSQAIREFDEEMVEKEDRERQRIEAQINGYGEGSARELTGDPLREAKQIFRDLATEVGDMLAKYREEAAEREKARGGENKA